MKRFKIFGYNIWVSKEPLKVVHKDKNRNSYRSTQRNLRLEVVGYRCEVCGEPIDKSCHIHRTLPLNATNRNRMDNIRVLCGKCWHEFQKKPHIHGYQHMEDVAHNEAE